MKTSNFQLFGVGSVHSVSGGKEVKSVDNLFPCGAVVVVSLFLMVMTSLNRKINSASQIV